LRTNIDATQVGNIARFINHSCMPNLIPYMIRIDSIIPRVVLFAARDIAPYEEITFSYGQIDTSNTNNRIKCLCGSVNCKLYLPYEP